MTAPNEVRRLMEGRFVIGAFTDRPAPAHIFNNFVLSAFGRSPGADRVRQFSRAPDALERLAQHPAIRTAGWADDRELLASLGETIWLVFDPDRRLFPKRGSPLPIDRRLASPDPSDDGLGHALWECLSGLQQVAVQGRLLALLDSEHRSDPASALAQFLLDGVARSVPPEVDPALESAFPLLGGLLQTLLGGIGRADSAAGRLEAIRQVGTLLHFCAVLGLLLEGLRYRRDTTSWESAVGAVVYTGLPPGDGDDPLVVGAQLSYRMTIADVHAGLRSHLQTRLQKQLDVAIPSSVRLQSAVLALLTQSGIAAPPKALDRLTSTAPVPSTLTAAAIDDWINQLMRDGYPLAHLSRGIRSTGNKIGFVGPVRGIGHPRFVLETPLLATLAQALVPLDRSLSFDDFVRAMRVDLGLIVGIGPKDQVPVGARVFGSDQVARQRLGLLGEQLRLRLIQAGLAREFSDAHTRVFSA